MRKISVFIMLGLLAIIAVHCVDNVISQPPNKLITERDPMYRDLRELEYRVRELGHIQRGIGELPSDTWLTVRLDKSYKDMNYTVLVSSNSVNVSPVFAEKLTTNSFRVKCGGSGGGYSWLTIGQ